jgi:flagellar hook-basal body complex protein FliE
MQPGTQSGIGDYLRTAHDKLMQAQQKISNLELNEQKLLEEALDAVNKAQQSLDSQSFYGS